MEGRNPIRLEIFNNLFMSITEQVEVETGDLLTIATPRGGGYGD